jgi:hypothetical protein
MARKPKWQVYRDVNDEWRFRLVAPNGKIIATGESYAEKRSCVGTIKKIQEYAAVAEIEEEK